MRIVFVHPNYHSGGAEDRREVAMACGGGKEQMAEPGDARPRAFVLPAE